MSRPETESRKGNARAHYFVALLVIGLACQSTPALSAESCTADASQELDDAWLEQHEARIGDVILDTRDVFETDKPDEDKALFRLANFLHINTRANTISSQLLFASGDLYSRRLLDETERLLRENRYLYEAQIYPVRYCDGIVDVVVRTRDVWTLKVGASGSRQGGQNKTNVEFEELNLFGFGTKLGINMRSTVDRDSVIFEYSDPHLGGSQARLSTKFIDSSDGQTTSFLLDRPFFALDTHWSAGVEFLSDDRIETLYDLGEPQAQLGHSRTYGQIHGGRSRGLQDGWVSRWSAGLVHDSSRFSAVEDSTSPLPVPGERTYTYPFLRYERLEDRYTTTQNHDQIGRTEDLYLGTHLLAELGYSSNLFGGANDALLFRLNAGTGIGDPDKTLWMLNTGLSGRVENGQAVNTRLVADAGYYRRQSDTRLLYIGASVLAAVSPDLDDPVYLGGDNGLRGYPLRYQGGDGKAFLTVEQRFYTDWYPFRLARVGGAVFAEVGRTWGRNALGDTGLGWLGDVGFGLRLSPTRSGRSHVVHLDVAFPLNASADIDNVQFLLETRRSF